MGTTVEMPNSDRVFHNVFSYHNGKRFDLGLYPAGTRKAGHLRSAGREPHLLQHPPDDGGLRRGRAVGRYAVTDADGRFVIDDVTAAPQAYSLWRAGAEPHAGTVTVVPGQPVTIDWR